MEGKEHGIRICGIRSIFVSERANILSGSKFLPHGLHCRDKLGEIEIEDSPTLASSSPTEPGTIFLRRAGEGSEGGGLAGEGSGVGGRAGGASRRRRRRRTPGRGIASGFPPRYFFFERETTGEWCFCALRDLKVSKNG
jgi:hypothetical protein